MIFRISRLSCVHSRLEKYIAVAGEVSSKKCAVDWIWNPRKHVCTCRPTDMASVCGKVDGCVRANEEGPVAVYSAVRINKRTELRHLWWGGQHMVNPLGQVLWWCVPQVKVGTMTALRQKTIADVEAVRAPERYYFLDFSNWSFSEAHATLLRGFSIYEKLWSTAIFCDVKPNFDDEYSCHGRPPMVQMTMQNMFSFI